MARGEGKGKGLMCVVCVSIVFALVMSLAGLVGLALSIWQIMDAVHINDELMKLANEAVSDSRLISAIYILLAFTIVSICFGGIGGCKKMEGEKTDKKSSGCGGLLSLILIGGYLASGILAVQYRSNSLPNIKTGMEHSLRSKQFLSSESPIETPSYTKLGEYYNFLQCKYKCCGIDLTNGGDYLAAMFPERYNLTIPYSCCVLKPGRKVKWHTVTLDDIQDYEQCSKFRAGYFHTNTCYSIEYVWLSFKADFLVGFNFAMVFFGLGSGILLCILLACACCCT